MDLTVKGFTLLLLLWNVVSLANGYKVKNLGDARQRGPGNQVLDNIFNLLENFQKLSSCCDVPSLLPQETLQPCIKAVGGRGGMQPQPDNIEGIFGSLRSFLPRGDPKSSYTAVCYADCLFAAYNLTETLAAELQNATVFNSTVQTFMNAANAVTQFASSMNSTFTNLTSMYLTLVNASAPDLTTLYTNMQNASVFNVSNVYIPRVNELADLLSSVLATTLTETWATVANAAFVNCLPTVARGATNTVVTSTGQTCATLPFNLMTCVRHYMTTNCPEGSLNTACTQTHRNFRRSGIFQFLG